MSFQTYEKPRVHRFSLIRTRLTLWIVMILVVGMLTFVLTTLVIANTLLQHQNEVRLRQTVITLSTALAEESDAKLSSIRRALDVFSNEGYLQYQNPQGMPLASSNTMGQLVLPLSQLRPAIVANRVDVLTFHGTSFFVYAHAIVTKGQIRGYILGAHTVTDHETLSLVLTLLYTGGGVTLIVIALLVWLLVRRMLRPLEHLAVSAARIARTSDHALRVQAEERPDEINSLAQTMNGMLVSLEGAYRDVQNVNDLQRRFLADVSHELRTPLTIMLSSLDLMKKERGGDLEFQANALENIYAETERMARLVTRLLMLARTDASTPFAREPLLISDIIGEVYLQGCTANRMIHMECQGLEALEDAVVSGNADYLKQVLLIMLENACKYTPEGGKVTIRGDMKEQNVEITIADTGIGINQADIPRLFERFYRAKNTRSQPGTGLGLSIAKSIIEQHNGTICVESTLNQGSCFLISLPLLNVGNTAFVDTLV